MCHAPEQSRQEGKRGEREREKQACEFRAQSSNVPPTYKDAKLKQRLMMPQMASFDWQNINSL